MKNIRNYTPNKYSTNNYTKVKEHIYETKKNDDSHLDYSFKEVTDEELKKIINNLTDWKKYKDEEDVLYTIYNSKKYYKFIDDDGDYVYEDENNSNIIYVTSIVFEPEPDLGENNPSDKIISQYPLEDILEKFFCYCLDDYSYENENDKTNSYVEFASENIEDIEKLLNIVGKHVYNRQEGDYIKLIIE